MRKPMERLGLGAGAATGVLNWHIGAQGWATSKALGDRMPKL